MTHIHITLVGGQRLPVYLGIKNCDPDEIIFVCSKNTQAAAERIAAEFPGKQISYRLFDPVDFEEICTRAKEMADAAIATPDTTYSVNVSGGTKIWSIAFYEYFTKAPSATVFYLDQNNCYRGLHPVNTRSIDTNADIATVFRINGQTATSSRFEEYDAQDREVAHDLARLLDTPGVLNGLINTKKHDCKTQKKGKVTQSNNLLSWDETVSGMPIVQFITKHQKRHRWQSPHVMDLVFRFGFFEYQVAEILSGWPFAQDIRLNVKFGPKNNEKNEVDIIVNTGARLLFVECKTKINQPTDIDKFSSVLRNYAGMGCKGLFVQRDPLKPQIKEKCADNKIKYFSLQENNFDPRKLFDLLDNEIFSINA